MLGEIVLPEAVVPDATFVLHARYLHLHHFSCVLASQNSPPCLRPFLPSVMS